METIVERAAGLDVHKAQVTRDIAQTLYVTPKTVEVHLSSVYRKLQIASRAQPLGALAAGGAVTA